MKLHLKLSAKIFTQSNLEKKNAVFNLKLDGFTKKSGKETQINKE